MSSNLIVYQITISNKLENGRDAFIVINCGIFRAMGTVKKLWNGSVLELQDIEVIGGDMEIDGSSVGYIKKPCATIMGVLTFTLLNGQEAKFPILGLTFTNTYAKAKSIGCNSQWLGYH